MAYKALDVANWFIHQFAPEDGDLITHLKLQKLLYYAEAWSQVLVGRDLFEEQLQAWAHGPVVPAVFFAFKDYGYQPLEASGDLPTFDEDTLEVLQETMTAYGNISAKVLEAMSHTDEPWIRARAGLAPEARCETVIPKDEIKSYFQQKYGSLLVDG